MDKNTKTSASKKPEDGENQIISTSLVVNRSLSELPDIAKEKISSKTQMKFV